MTRKLGCTLSAETVATLAQDHNKPIVDSTVRTPSTPMATNSPRFRVKKDNSGYYYWIFYGANNEEIARSSESYTHKSSCLHSIALVRNQGPAADVYDWSVPADANGQYSAISPNQII